MADQLEVKSEVKRLQLSSETAAISFQAKERECGSLLQLNQEVLWHVHSLSLSLSFSLSLSLSLSRSLSLVL